MATPMLKSVRWKRGGWQAHHGVVVTYARRGKTVRARYVPPDGALTLAEAGALLSVSRMFFHRRAAAGTLRLRNVGQVTTVSLAECRRVARERAGS